MIVNIQNKSEIKAEGTRTNGNCKPVYCITTGEIYTSVSDAAEANGVTLCAMSWMLNGRTKTCNKKKFCYVSKITEHLDEIAEINRYRTSKITVYDEMMVRKENIRKAKEKVLDLRSKLEEAEKELIKLREGE